MNPEFLKFLASLNPKYDPQIHQLMTSPLVDSLSTLSGGAPPKFGRMSFENSQQAQGSYYPNQDSISIDPTLFAVADAKKLPISYANSNPNIMALLKQNKDINLDKPENVMMHEMGHRMLMGGGGKGYVPDTMQPAFESLYNAHKDDPTFSARNTNPQELGAWAFQHAVSILRDEPQKQSKQDVLDKINYAEQNYPGTSMMLSYLLQQPIYKNHPYNQIFGGAQGSQPVASSGGGR